MNPAPKASVGGNPIIKNKYTADPAALVYNDKVYLCAGPDEAPPKQERYGMNEWLCYSSSDTVNWTEHPVPLAALTRIRWLKMKVVKPAGLPRRLYRRLRRW